MMIKGNFIESLGADDLRCQKGCLSLDDSGKILGFSTDAQQKDGEEILDFGDQLILQGFCDVHLHAPQYPMRGIGLGLTLLDWLETYTFPTESKFADVNYAQSIYKQLAQELRSLGSTRTVVFSSIHTDGTLVLMDALEEAGLSGYVGKVNMDRNGGQHYEETTEESIYETNRWLSEVKTRWIKPIITPRFTPCCSDELMKWLGTVAREKNLAIQSHLSENQQEVQWVKELHPDCARYWQTYEKFGLWNDHTVMAHCEHSDQTERKAIKQAGVLVAHCPDSNINLTSGMAPIATMLDEGIKVGLGSDISGGDQLFMLRIMRSAITTSKMRHHITGEKIITPSQAYYMATSASQPFFGDQIGFGMGDDFHAVVFDDHHHPSCSPLSLKERLERLIYVGEREDITAVFARGVRVV